MPVVSSRDGAPIAYGVSGSGPSLVLVHGTTTDSSRWGPALALLGERFTCFAMDRRGRGGSGDGPVYSLEREHEDVVAVLEAAGAGACLLGHSFGAVCALGAARLWPVRRLVLYEPPVPGGRRLAEDSVHEKLAALLAAGDREGVVLTFLREVLRLPFASVTALRFSPGWQGLVASAATVVREMDVERKVDFGPAQFSDFTIPTLLLAGTESPEFLRRATFFMHGVLATSRLRELPGQGHTAMSTAPELFVREVVAFLEGRT
jgi:pimeloyl-ACP methyl ester carboxylesterase